MNRLDKGAQPPECHACGARELDVAPAYARFHRVTSDCKPWPAGGSLARCRACGLVQTLVTPAWQAEAEEIYRGYTIYHQSGGSEQRVFDSRTGAGAPRSERIVRAFRQAAGASLPEHGRLLDIGCGNGAFLSAWSRLVPGWSLCGSEVDDKHRAEIEAIPGVERLYTGPVTEIPGEFDLVSMVHVLEHIPGPAAFLGRLWCRLRPGGHVLIEVPDCEQNPYMLLVADHCSHFSTALLAGVVETAGLEVVEAGSTWVAKEVSLVARKPPPAPVGGTSAPASSGKRTVTPTGPQPHAGDCGSRSDFARPELIQASERVFANCQRLEAILAKVQPLARQPDFGLFGTAIAATWLDAQTNRAARFFVDEDMNRIGRTHLGRPILAPGAVPSGATVFVALPQPLAEAVAVRLRQVNPAIQVVRP